jgi:glycine cleavage system aminomethyltransferase T
LFWGHLWRGLSHHRNDVKRDDKLFKNGKEVGHITSAVFPRRLGYVRREANAIGTELNLYDALAEVKIEVIEHSFIHEVH